MALSDDLVAYYSLDEASGNAIDAHGSADGTDNNTVGSGTGKVSGARTFNGSDEFFSVTLGSSSTSWTIAAWVNLAADGAYPMIFAKSAFSIDFRFLGISRRPEIVMSGVSDTTSADALSTGTWYFIAATSNGSLVTLYVDAVSKASNSGSPPSWTGSCTMGKRSDGYLLNGSIDELGIWDRDLSGSEITELYNAGAGRDYAYITGGGGGATVSFLTLLGVG